MRKQLLISLTVLAFLAIGTIMVVLYGSGYRFGLDTKGKLGIAGTGLLVATSQPNGAEVFINGHLTTATDNTINLAPADYRVKIFKEGYFPWEKTIKVQKEVVSKADALLFPTTPKLEGITSSGVNNPQIDPSFTRLAYTIASGSARKNGIYVLDMSSRSILTLQNPATQIADDTIDFFSKANLSWSTDGQEILATIPVAFDATKGTTTYLLSASSFNQNPKDISATLDTVKANFAQEKKEKDDSRVAGLEAPLRSFIPAHFSIIAWSPDDTKILYQASSSATIPIIVKPPLIGTNSTPEERKLTESSIYVYDLKEDKNYKILDSKTNPETLISWHPGSRHLIVVRNKRIEIIDYDGLNVTTISALPFIDNYVYPWPNGSKIVILTNLDNPTIPANLYTVGLK